VSECVESCRTPVTCTTCGRTKAPRGRDVPPAMAGDLCTRECEGYMKRPTAGHLWPEEELVRVDFVAGGT
jgi:hypothetical protein